MKNYIVLFFVVLYFQSQAQTTFQKKIYLPNDSETGNDFVMSSDGNYMIAGYRTDLINTVASLIKVDAHGNIVWKKEYPNIFGFSSIISTIDNGYALTGTLNSDMLILKTDSSGNVQWCKQFGLANSYDNGTELVQDQNGGFLLTGSGYDVGMSTGFAFILKTDSTGNLIWDKRFQGMSYLVAASYISITNDGGVIVTGTYFENNVSSLIMMKIDSSGLTSWTRKYGVNFYGHDSHQTNDGGYISTGMGYSGGIPFSYLLLKTDSLGNLQWSQVYSNGNEAPDLIISADGNYVLAGTYESANDSAIIILAKINSVGDTLWTRFYKTDPQWNYRGESANGILQTPDGGYLIGGEADVNMRLTSDIYLIKTDADGYSGCNLVNRTLHMELITPPVDTNITLTSGITSTPFVATGVVSIVSDSTLCFFDFVHEIEHRLPIEVFPNPVTDQINIYTPMISPEELTLEINDLMGRKIFQQKINSGIRETIDVSTFSKGVYIVRINGRNGTGVGYFCKQ